jgi:hypothetical protein
MSILESQYLRPAICFALAIPFLVYDFSSVNWIVLSHRVDLSQPTVVSDTFHVPKTGAYLVQLGVIGQSDDCVWGITGDPCENAHRELDADWKVTEEGRVVVDGHSAAGFPGTWSTAEGGKGVTLGSFDGLSGKTYALSLVVHSTAPHLMSHKPQITVEAGQRQRNVDLLKHAAAFVVAMLLLVGSIVVAMHTARKRGAAVARERHGV